MSDTLDEGFDLAMFETRLAAAEAEAAEAKAQALAVKADAKVCADAERRRDKRRKWVISSVAGSGGLLVSLLLWAVTKLEARADAAAQERIRIQMIQRHEEEIRALQLQAAGFTAVLGHRAVSPAPNP